MTAWKTEQCASEPQPFEQVSASSWIQRKDITKVDVPETETEPAHSYWTCQSRFLTLSEYTFEKEFEAATADRVAIMEVLASM
jgi:hypothetical protein